MNKSCDSEFIDSIMNKNDIRIIEPKVSIILINWNTPEMTIECIESILKSNYNNFEVILIDNGSDDNSSQIFNKIFQNHKKIRIFNSPKNLGYAGGMNYGLDKASKSSPEYFLVMNNDAVIDSQSITSLVITAKKYSNNCVVTGKVYDYYKNNTLQTIGFKFDRQTLAGERLGFNEEDIGQYDEEKEREMIDDIFMLIPSNIYKKVGGYSPFFFLNYEQTDLVLRIQNKGYSSIYTPDAKLWHKGSYSSGGIGNPLMMFWEGKSKIILHKLHQSNQVFISFYIRYLFKSIYGLIKGLIGKLIGRKNNLKSRYALFRGILSGTYWLFNRKYESGYNPFQTKK